MKRSVLHPALVVLVLAVCLTPQVARAQPPGTARPNPPAVSPYLNLLRPGANNLVSPSDLANNYYNLVVPQIQYGNAINSLQQQVTTVGAAVAGTQPGGVNAITTGHPVQFLNYSTYYPGIPGGRARGPR